VFRISAPGTILTFFPWVDATVGQRGVGQANQTAFRVPLRSIDYWINRFIQRGISHQTQERRFGETVLSFADQDGMALALVGIADAENEPGWSNGDIPSEHAIRGFQGVTLLLDNAQSTSANPEACCSRSRPIFPDLSSTNRSKLLVST
jgi:glyoxalase family protein